MGLVGRGGVGRSLIFPSEVLCFYPLGLILEYLLLISQSQLLQQKNLHCYTPTPISHQMTPANPSCSESAYKVATECKGDIDPFANKRHLFACPASPTMNVSSACGPRLLVVAFG